MAWISRVSAFIRRILARQRVERELNDEVDACLDILVERHMARGLLREQAWRAARMDFGGPEQVKEKVREVRMGFSIGYVFAGCAIRDENVVQATNLQPDGAEPACDRHRRNDNDFQCVQ